ncbi:methyltransferase domain-containing protein [Amycolatopsis sp. PS_44_ISF1]|uniref:class I SAM-dependent methyltransferase n=1 Tax=Amycolatopsis sp. PS_44_ISF1 TaxID=2974917 RepID=UPI0028DD8238|nr:methyltransferase domain-containing protein [Amycolatopsis sp. PS_44_ISF1]MDT8912202.1 class I SAM-dependent methyltransferase [Amycolatopsis sp. PS_44_ISF1]
MGPRDTLLAGIARQPGRSIGLRGPYRRPAAQPHQPRPRDDGGRGTGGTPGETALDIGFGGGLGLLLQATNGGTVHGAATMLARARRAFPTNRTAGRLVLHKGSLTASPLPDAAVTTVITANTVYFVPDLAPASEEIARIPAPGSPFVIGNPAAMAKAPLTGHGLRLRPVADLERALATAGLVVRGHQRIGERLSAFHLLMAEPGQGLGHRGIHLRPSADPR